MEIPFAEFLTQPVIKVLLGLFSALFLVTIISVIPQAPVVFKRRVTAWWFILIGICLTLLISRLIATITLGFLAFVAFREFSSRLNLRLADRRTLLWCYVAIPFQFMTAYWEWYGMFLIFIPVIMYVFLSARSVAQGDPQGITTSLGLIHWTAMLTIFSLSHLAYILSFPAKDNFAAGNGGILLWLVLMTEANDVFQKLCDKGFGKRQFLPTVSPDKTWEGFVGAIVLTTLLGWSLNMLLPIGEVKAAILAAALSFIGLMGEVTLRAIKQDLGVKVIGGSISRAGGVMDRIDSLAFNSLVCFHLVRYWSYL